MTPEVGDLLLLRVAWIEIGLGALLILAAVLVALVIGLAEEASREGEG